MNLCLPNAGSIVANQGENQKGSGRPSRSLSPMVPPAGFEPAIYTLKGCCPGPLDDGGHFLHYSDILRFWQLLMV
jgi:hypothetical protein